MKWHDDCMAVYPKGLPSIELIIEVMAYVCILVCMHVSMCTFMHVWCMHAFFFGLNVRALLVVHESTYALYVCQCGARYAHTNPDISAHD